MQGGRRWYLLTGLLIGLGLGLLVAWVIYPVQYVNSSPYSLGESSKESYRSMIAQAYLADGDLERARQRLILLRDTSPVQVLADQAQRLVAKNGSPQEARALAQLAADLQKASGGATAITPAGKVSRTPTPDRPSKQATPSPSLELGQVVLTPTSKPSKTPKPMATFTPRVTVAFSPTPGAPFALEKKARVCDPKLPNALLQVEVHDGAGQPAADVRVDVTWNGGQDSFYTGLFPEMDAGYADFSMASGVTYSLQVGDGGELVSKLEAPECTNTDGSTFLGGYYLTFNQP
jgi:hypothetical protein